MRMKHFTVDGIDYRAEFFCGIQNSKTSLYISRRSGDTYYPYKALTLHVYYRLERTLDDYMGNPLFRYYVNVPVHNGKRKRVYMY